MTKTTVIGLEKDYVFWNTTVPSATFCPTQNRLDNDLVIKFCKDRGVDESFLDGCMNFMESLANTTYRNLKNIKDFKDVEVGFWLSGEIF